MKIAISGASGFVGTALRKSFEDVVAISRADFKDNNLNKIKDCDVVINLAGAPIIKRWSDEYKKELYSSRIDTTKALVDAIKDSSVKYFISTSAVGFYPEDKACDEESCSDGGDDFLANLCKDWETEAKKCSVDTAIVRFGIVLDKSGGALAQMYTPFSMGLGGPIGDGKSWFSWIDLKDLVSIFHFLIDNKLSGTFNATAPNPVLNKDFTKSFAQVLHKPAFLPIPKFALHAMYSEGATVLTGSKRVYPKMLLSKGFEFQYKSIDECLKRNYGDK